MLTAIAAFPNHATPGHRTGHRSGGNLGKWRADVFDVAADWREDKLPTRQQVTAVCAWGPEWEDLVGECRQVLGKSPSDSVHWKKHAADRYGLPLDNERGVRHIVRTLDLSGVKLPSIQAVLESIVTWATAQT
jgi:hypothetical protein